MVRTRKERQFARRTRGSRQYLTGHIRQHPGYAQFPRPIRTARKFVPDFAKISALLMGLRAADQKEFDTFKAGEARWRRVKKAVDFLKAAVIARPALALPQRNNYNDSDFAIRATLC